MFYTNCIFTEKFTSPFKFSFFNCTLLLNYLIIFKYILPITVKGSTFDICPQLATLVRRLVDRQLKQRDQKQNKKAGHLKNVRNRFLLNQGLKVRDLSWQWLLQMVTGMPSFFPSCFVTLSKSSVLFRASGYPSISILAVYFPLHEPHGLSERPQFPSYLAGR